MAVIDLMLEEDENGWHVIKRVPQLVELAPFEEDSSMRKLLEPYHRMALEDAGKVIGMLVGEALAPKGKEGELPPFLTQDTPLLNLYQSMMLYYSGARVSAIPMSNEYADLQPGEIHKSDIALLFRYLNYLYTLKMSGSQLKQFMEWSAGFFEFWTEGTVVQKSNNLPLYNYHMFGGVRYDVNLAEPVGSRIENLIWQDTGLPVKPEDVFDIAVTDYAARSYLLIPGIIYDEGDLPTLKQQNVYADIGPIRDLLMDFIVNVKNGVLEPYCSDSWKVVTRKRCKKRAFFRR